jgi:DNA-binding LytR/AlgR family response regulator
MNRSICIVNCHNKEAETVIRALEDFSEFNCLGISNEYEASLQLILKTLPDIIFFDIDHKGRVDETSSFDLVNELYQYLDYLPIMIALSTNTERAYDAFKKGFFDYLLQPLSELSLRRLFLRLKKNHKPAPARICLKSYSDYRFISLEDILFLKADGNTTDFVLVDEVLVTAYNSLKTYDSLLPKNFLRVHKSFIVNTDFLIRINFSKSHLVLANKKQIPFSRGHRNQLELLKETFFTLKVV